MKHACQETMLDFLELSSRKQCPELDIHVLKEAMDYVLIRKTLERCTSHERVLRLPSILVRLFERTGPLRGNLYF